jgi:hypothetical protein
MAREEQARARPIDVHFTEEAAEFEADLVLLPGSAVSGTVLDAGGAFAPNVDVRLTPEVRYPSGYLGASARTVADGLFRFEKVPAGKHRIGAGPGEPKGTAVAVVECNGLSDVTGVVLRIEGPAAPRVGRISGRVIDDIGASIPILPSSISMPIHSPEDADDPILK